MIRRRWAGHPPAVGMVFDGFPNEGYLAVVGSEPDPDAIWEMQAFGPQIPELRPQTCILVFRPATNEEVANDRAFYEGQRVPKERSIFEHILQR